MKYKFETIIITQADITEALLDLMEKKTGHRPKAIGPICLNADGKAHQAQQLDKPAQDIIWCDDVEFDTGNQPVAVRAIA